MTESFKLDLAFESRAMKISKLMIDIDEFSFVHEDGIMKDELIFDTNISTKFKQKLRLKS